MTITEIRCDYCNKPCDAAKPRYKLQSMMRAPSVDADLCSVFCIRAMAEKLDRDGQKAATLPGVAT